ncbi:autotransporter domain-containing protein [Solidesulfovibrio sp.]
MRHLIVALLIACLPLPGLARAATSELGYIVRTGDNRAETNSINGWTYTTTTGTAYTRVNDPTFQALSYDSSGRVVSYVIAGETRYLYYGDDAASQVRDKAASATLQQTGNGLNLLASQRAIDRTIFDRLFTTLVTSRLRAKGLSAGDDAPASVSAWADGSYTMQGSSRTGSQHASNQYLALAGLDYTASDRLTLGFGAGFNQNDTQYHAGKSSNQRDDAFLFNPYAGFTLWDRLFLGLQAGLKFGRTSLSGNLSGDYQSLTTSAGGFLTYAFIHDRLLFTPVVGYSYSYRNPYTDAVTATAVGIAKAGGRLTYSFEKFLPYIDLGYNYDTVGQIDGQRSDMLGILGADFLLTQQLRASLLVSNTFFRDKEYCTTFDLSLRYSF